MRTKLHITRGFAIVVVLVVSAVAEDKPTQPAIDPQLTIAHLNKIIEAQAIHIVALQAQLDDAIKGRQLAAEVASSIGMMQASCAAHDAVLAINPQTGLYAPDEKGMPRCVPNPPKQETKKEAAGK